MNKNYFEKVDLTIKELNHWLSNFLIAVFSILGWNYIRDDANKGKSIILRNSGVFKGRPSGPASPRS